MRTTTHVLVSLLSLALFVGACGPAEEAGDEEIATEGVLSSEDTEVGTVSQHVMRPKSETCSQRHQYRFAHCNPRNGNQGIIGCKARHNDAILKSKTIICMSCTAMGKLDPARVFCEEK